MGYDLLSSHHFPRVGEGQDKDDQKGVLDCNTLALNVRLYTDCVKLHAEGG